MKKNLFFLSAALLLSSFQLMAQWTDNEGIMYTLDTIGIGTTNPDSKLHINSAPGLNGLRVQINNATKFLVSSNGGTSIGINSTPPTNGLYVLGNMGIGTSNPEAKLHIFNAGAGNITAPAFCTLVTENNNHNYISILAPSGKDRGILFGDNLDPADGGIFYSGTENSMHFTANGNVLRMKLTSDGYLGIGTSTPEARLHVYRGSAGSITASSLSTLVLESNTYNYMSMLAPSNTGSGIWFGNESSALAAGILYGADGISFNIGLATKMKIHQDGSIDVLGSMDVLERLRAQEILVETGWSDYVFDKNYKLRSLKEVENYILQNKHLPGIPEASEIKSNGLKVAEMSTKMMEKIEELTLYLIDINKRVETLENENADLKKQIANQKH